MSLPTKSIAFVDTRVADYQTLIAGLPAELEVIVIDGGDGLQQMADALAGRSDIDAIHVFSHGSAGSMQLGDTTLNSANLNTYVSQLASIGQSLTSDGDLMLYGCNVGAGAAGQSFVESVAKITQADVAASNDLTGAADKGGDWVLEVATGNIDNPAVQSPGYGSALGFITNLVADINSGSGGQSTGGMAILNNVLYFKATNGTNGAELWKYDGSNQPSMVMDINPGAGNSNPSNLTVFNSALYFSADDGTNGAELWKYDGTNTPTLVADINTVAATGSSISGNIYSKKMTEFNGALYFSANDGTNGSELWKYDGTNAPTMVANLYAGATGSNVDYLTEFNGALYFAGSSSTLGGGLELLKYDGTNATKVAEIYAGGTGSNPSFLTVFNNALYFKASNSTQGYELWKYDGTNTPAMVADINTAGASGAYQLRVFNNALYFSADDGTNGYELWKYDGTNTPSMVADIRSGNSSLPLFLTVFNNELYFQANDGTNGNELCKYDGTNPPAMAANIFAASSSSTPSDLTLFNGGLYFWAANLNIGTELHRYVSDNVNPTISDVTNQTVNEEANTGALAVTIGDTETAAGSLTLTGASSNTTLIPNGNIVFGGSNGSRTVTVTPAANATGVATITLTVIDAGGGTATDTFTVTVNDVDPSISNATLSVAENSANGTAVGTVTASNDTNGLTYAITAGNTGSVFAINSSTGAITVNGSLNYETTNSYSLTVTVDDEDVDTTADSTATITVNLTNVNETPTANNDTGSATEAGGTANGTAGSNASGNVLGNDVDTDSGSSTGLTVTSVRVGSSEGAGAAGTLGNALAGSYGLLTLNSDGTFSYAVTDNNSSVQGLSSGQTLTDSFNYTTSDGALTDVAVLTVTINGANDSPTLDVSKTPVLGNVPEDTAPTNGTTTGSTLVSALVDAGGALSNFADPDSGTTAGIAISSIAAGGNLWYSTNAGTTWTQATGLNATNTLKLTADANTRVYVESTTANFIGTISDAVTFSAWDGGGAANGSIGGNTYSTVSLSSVGSLAVTSTRGFTVSGNYAYLADQGGGFKIADITDPANPSLVGQVTTTGSPQNVAVSGNYAYVTVWGSGLSVVNIANPASPSQVGVTSGSWQADSVAVSGNYAYVADYGGSLKVVNIATPGSPTLAQTLTLGGGPQDVAIVGNTAYVPSGTAGLKVVDISNPTSSTVIGTLATTITDAKAIAISGNYAYICSSFSLYIVDISNPANPTHVGNVSVGTWAYDVSVDGNYAYVATNTAGVKLINISNPAAPTVDGTLDTPDTAWGSDLKAGYVFIADGSSLRAIARTETSISSVSSTTDTANVTVTETADTPAVTNATTNEDTQSASGLVISRNAADGAGVTHFKITSITGGTLFKSDGTTQITNSTFITYAEANAGLKFTPTANSNTSGSFNVQASISNVDGGLGGSTATATITVNPVGDTPAVTNTTTNEDTQSSSGLVISRNVADSTEVTHFKISTISGGTLYKNDGTTQITDGSFITFAEGNAGLKFTPAANLTTSGTFNIQSSRDGSTAEGTAATATASITPIADTPSVTNTNTTPATQTSSGLVLSRNAADSTEVTHFKITGITNGNLFQSNGTTAINDGNFITYAEGHAGLKFTPTGGGDGIFTSQASTSAADGGLGGSTVNASIAVGAAVASPTVNEDTDSGAIAITLGGSETHYKITSISGGTLYSDAAFTQPITASSFIAQGGGGGNATTTNVYFRPTANANTTTGGNGSFVAQASTSNADGGLIGSQISSTVTLTPVADTPSVSNATTGANTQSTSGLVLSLNAADGAETTHFKISTISGGTLYKNDGTTQITDGSFITFAEGNAGLKFTPTANSTSSGSFNVEASTNGTTVAGSAATATVTVAAPAITSANYNATTHVLSVTGTNLPTIAGGTNDIDLTKLTLTGEGGETVTLSGTNVEITNSTSFSVTLSGADLAIEQILNKAGTSSTGGTNYNLAMATGWAPGYATTPADLTSNGITVSNPNTPVITSATYDASTGALVVTATGLIKKSGATNDIDASKLTFTGEGGTTYSLTDSADVEITSGTAFTVTLSATDKAALNKIINKNGTASTGATTYNLAAAEDWAVGADTAVVVADLTGNGVTASNVAVPTITSATYDTGTGALVVTGTGFLNKAGATNDIDASMFTLTGEAVGTYTLTDTADVEITSGTTFTVTLSSTDKTAVNAMLNKTGATSNDSTTYNLAAAEDWATGADATVVIADLTSNAITNTVYVAPSGGGGSSGSTSTTTTVTDPVTGQTTTVSNSTSTTSTTTDGVSVSNAITSTTKTVTDPVTGQTTTVNTSTSTTTVPVITDSRQEQDQTTPQADIPLVQNGSGEPLLQATLPIGVGLTSEATTGASLSLRDQLIAASEPRSSQSGFVELHGQIDKYVQIVNDETQVTVRTITFQTTLGQVASESPIVINGANGTGEQDASHPNRQEALVIDVRNLPSGTVLQLNNVEFAIIIGAAKVTGGSGRNVAVGDDSAQYIVLGAEDDELHGGGGDDTVGSQGGNDQLYGDAGNDTVFGGSGNDTLHGGTGNDNMDGDADDDTLNGDEGDDTANGGNGNDSIDGGAGNDALYGDAGNDTANGGAGNDTLHGGTGNDALDGNADDDTLLGDDGNDTANGGNGNDSIDGDIGDDRVYGDAGNDIILGGEGNDLVDGGSGDDSLNGGTGSDTASYADITTAVTVKLTFGKGKTISYSGGNQSQDTGGGGLDTLQNIENITGSAFNDNLVGDIYSNILQGGAGDDKLDGGKGLDAASYADASAAVSVKIKSKAQDTGGAGKDTLKNVEGLIGSAFNDTLTGSAGKNTIEGGTGDDVLNGGAGNDTVSYANAASGVTIDLNVILSQNTVAAGSDTLKGFENVTGSAYADIITGTKGNNLLNGGAENDTLSAGKGNDTLLGGTGADTLTGGAGNDKFIYTVTTEGGDTIVDFVSGKDKLVFTGSAFDTAKGKVKAVNFLSSDEGIAQTANQHFIYNMTSHTLSYDADGSGAGTAVVIAIIGVDATFKVSDIVIA